MRNHRKNTVLAAAAIAALSLGLTACGGGDDASGAKDAGSATASPSTAGTGDGGTAGGATANQTATKGGSGSTGGSASGGSTAGGSTASTGSAGGSKAGSGTGGSTGSTGGKSSAAAPACAYGDIKVTAAKADEVPTEHITLTATNTSGRSCTLLEYPLIAFGPIQTAKDVPAVAKSKPAAPVVLKPGAPAYANVRIALGGAHEDNRVVNEFNVNLFAAQGPAEGSIVVKAPAGGLAVDEAAAKTGYWTYELRNGADEF
ncbi:uncharacterized protein DUF4232 [Streptomyces sp. PanSC19]|uniref:DUF4232 domain-containing protein n=1 Tax=Streptomyces sp. PanSC19 TaxID=1520455 RepID=UPI000F49D2D6|nr:DUF4232 domain-containing protein [Streptomyces sp. PanSC19]ROQ34147.1 uncharacterized protein DUF4232 [Streptomyces sp. PanSC19]